MANTAALGLPLVQASQSQKHVTVNEALARLDALTQLTLASRSTATPPLAPEDGETYAVPNAATGAWTGAEGELALFLNGGWVFVAPKPGWRAWIADEGVPGQWDGTDWISGAGAVSTHGAGMTFRVIEIDHAVGTGATSDTSTMIPAQSVVFGVTGIVTAPLGGTATSWRLGVAGVSDNRYGSGLGMAQGAWLRGLTSEPLTYYADTALRLTGEGGALDGGNVRLAVHIAELSLPRP